MKHNPKVVSFDRSAAYVHHRAMKNMRNNNPVDALELMRHAVEHSPDNREYLLDLAETIDQRIETMKEENPSLTTAKASVLISMELLDEYRHLEADYENFRKEMETLKF